MNKAVQLRGLRGKIAARMMESLNGSAQVTLFTDIDAGALVAERDRQRKNGGNIGYEDLIIRALCKILPDHPSLNGRINDVTLEMLDQVDISLAIALPEGLVTATLFSAQSKNLREIAAARGDLIERARGNRLTVPEMTQGTITISNLGITRINYSTPIINPGQVAIVALGQISLKPRVDMSGEVKAIPTMGISLTVDHRFIDGAPAGAFLTDLSRELEQGY